MITVLYIYIQWMMMIGVAILLLVLFFRTTSRFTTLLNKFCTTLFQLFQWYFTLAFLIIVFT